MTNPVHASLSSVNDAMELKNFFLGFAIIAKEGISTEGTAGATATAIESSSADANTLYDSDGIDHSFQK